MKALQHIGEAALFGVAVVGMGMLLCLFTGLSFAWSPVLGCVFVVVLVVAGEQI